MADSSKLTAERPQLCRVGAGYPRFGVDTSAPLTEPDVQFSRIRLFNQSHSDTHRVYMLCRSLGGGRGCRFK